MSSGQEVATRIVEGAGAAITGAGMLLSYYFMGSAITDTLAHDTATHVYTQAERQNVTFPSEADATPYWIGAGVAGSLSLIGLGALAWGARTSRQLRDEREWAAQFAPPGAPPVYAPAPYSVVPQPVYMPQQYPYGYPTGYANYLSHQQQYSVPAGQY